MATCTCFLIICSCLSKKKIEEKSHKFCVLNNGNCALLIMRDESYMQENNKTFLMIQDKAEVHTSFAVSFRMTFP